MGARGEEVEGEQGREMGPGTGGQAEERRKEVVVAAEEVVEEGKKEVHCG